MGVVKARDLINFLKPRPQPSCMSEDEHRVWGYLLAFINGASEEGNGGPLKLKWGGVYGWCI